MGRRSIASEPDRFTPAGVGAFHGTIPEGLLKICDVARVEFDGIGESRNTVVEEPDGFVVPDTKEAPAWVY